MQVNTLTEGFGKKVHHIESSATSHHMFVLIKMKMTYSEALLPPVAKATLLLVPMPLPDACFDKTEED